MKTKGREEKKRKKKKTMFNLKEGKYNIKKH